MPLIRRIPKRGFNNARFKTTFHPINLATLNKFDNGAVVDRESLQAAGLIKSRTAAIKVLGAGELSKKLTVKAAAFSAAAKAAIEKLGGQALVA